MIRALFFIVKVVILVAIAIWVAERPGTVSFEWLDNKVTMHIGLFFLLALGGMLLALTLFRILKGVADMPKTLGRYRREMARDKGYRALTLGLTAVAAGDAKVARYQAHRASKLLPEDKGLPLLLEAQAARLNGDETKAAHNFVALLENNDTAFLGIRGLLQSALDMQDFERAKLLADKALELHPKQPWILRVAYDLQIRARDFEAAGKTLYRAQKAKAIEADKANSDRIAMLLLQVEDLRKAGNNSGALTKIEKAYGYDRTHIPTVLYLADAYIRKGKRRKAQTVIQKAWKVNTHPDLVQMWKETLPPAKQGNHSAVLKHFERLLAVNTASAEGQMAVASAAMDAGLWGEARNYLNMAEGIRASAKLYKLYAALEERSNQDEIAVKHWLEKAADAPGDRVWVCRDTGRIYASWSPIAEPHGAFNTIHWDFPMSNDNAPQSFAQLSSGAQIVLDAPK